MRADVMLLALALALGDGRARADLGFDAIFYRARAGFHFCYSFAGSAGWSLRPIAARITHDGGASCASGATALDQKAALADCDNGECHADCASFVRRAWAAGTNLLLRPVETPTGGNCANPTSFGADHFLPADLDADTMATRLADARPGDWCSNADHVLMLFARHSGARWVTWEANSSAVGIGPRSVTLGPDWFGSMPRNDCGFPSVAEALAQSGCWHPPAVRTGAPKPLLPAEAAEVVGDELDHLALRVQRPDNLPALADYLLWLRWNDGSAWQHRLVRIPAFTYRDQAERRLATFPGQTTAGAQPLDVSDVTTLEVAYAALRTAPAAIPSSFKDPDSGLVSDGWTPTSNLVPRPPERFELSGLDLAEDLVGPRTVTWRVRVDRYAEASGDGRGRVSVIPPCKADASGRETVEYCKEPVWSEARTFVVRPCTVPGCPHFRVALGELTSPWGSRDGAPPNVVLRGAGAFDVTIAIEPALAPTIPIEVDLTLRGCESGGAVVLSVGGATIPTDPAGATAWYTMAGTRLRYAFQPFAPPHGAWPVLYDDCMLSASPKALINGARVPIPAVSDATTWVEIDARPLYEIPVQFIQATQGANAVSGAYCKFDDLANIDDYHTWPQYRFDDQTWIQRGGGDRGWGWSAFLARADVLAWFGGWDPFDLDADQAVWAWGSDFYTEYLCALPVWNAAHPYDPGNAGAAALYAASYQDAIAAYTGLVCVFEPYAPGQ
ncbi:MAG: hypothetical protein U1F43_02240 [Myxococcota bacterium]